MEASFADVKLALREATITEPRFWSLSRGECAELLATVPVGRFCASVKGELIVLPVNFALFEDDILVRTHPGSKLNAAMAGLEVAFEVDGYEPDGSAGWSVIVRGVAREIVVGGELAKALSVPLQTWAFRNPNRLIRISTTAMSGRRFERVD